MAVFGRSSSSNWEKIGSGSVVGIRGKNRAGDKEVYTFSVPVNEQRTMYVNLTVYPDSLFDINKGYNAGKAGMLGWASIKRKKRG